jgi:hypothetical protein
VAFDLGDPVPLTFSPTDAAGNPVDVTTAVVTVTLPDGSTATPAVVHGGTGAYSSSYPTTQSGRHRVNWVGTGTNAQNQVDTFFVLATDPGFIIGLAQARGGLRLPAGQTVSDEDLRDLIAAATPIMEDLCGPILSQTCDETHDGGRPNVRLLKAPIISVATVIESYGAGYSRTLTLQPPDGGTFDSYGYSVDLRDGVITRRVSGVATVFVAGRRNIHVTYVAGRSVLPANLVRGTRRLIRWLWQTEMQGQRPQGSQPEGTTTTPGGYRVPTAVVAICGAEVRIPGIG